MLLRYDKGEKLFFKIVLILLFGEFYFIFIWCLFGLFLWYPRICYLVRLYWRLLLLLSTFFFPFCHSILFYFRIGAPSCTTLKYLLHYHLTSNVKYLNQYMDFFCHAFSFINQLLYIFQVLVFCLCLQVYELLLPRDFYILNKSRTVVRSDVYDIRSLMLLLKAASNVWLTLRT